MDLTFGQVASALMKTYAIADDKQGAFIARLQHLQKLKFPAGTNTGRGRAAKYDVGHLFQLGVALELGQLGVTPERAKGVIEDDMHAVAMAASLAASGGPPTDKISSPVFLYCDPAVLSALVDRSDDRATSTFFYAGMGQVLENFRDWFENGVPRMAFFSVSTLIYDLACHSSPDIDDLQPFYSAIEEWAHPFIHNVEEADGDDT